MVVRDPQKPVIVLLLTTVLPLPSLMPSLVFRESSRRLSIVPLLVTVQAEFRPAPCPADGRLIVLHRHTGADIGGRPGLECVEIHPVGAGQTLTSAAKTPTGAITPAIVIAPNARAGAACANVVLEGGVRRERLAFVVI